jgi:hypothetical protein
LPVSEETDLGHAWNLWKHPTAVQTANRGLLRVNLLEKYPQFADPQGLGSDIDVDQNAPDSADEEISVLGELAEAGGPAPG